MDIEKAKNRCNELVKVEHANWVGISNQVAIKAILNELDNKDKIINEMAEIIEECRQNNCLESDEIDLSEIAGKDRIIDYFTKKVEGK